MSYAFLRSRRVVATGIHLLMSCAVAAVAATLVFLVWYPPPHAAVAGGVSLFLLLVSVDVVLGPALTAVAANPTKTRRALGRDIAVIVAIQLAAFAYGMYTIAMARPIYMVFEVDRLRVVTAADVDPATMADAAPGFAALPWFGPKLIAASKPTKPDEALRSIDLALGGIEFSMIPHNWRDYASQSDAAWKLARPLPALVAKYPETAAATTQIAAKSGQSIDALRFLPLVSRQASWTAVLAAPDARIVGYLPVDAFF